MQKVETKVKKAFTKEQETIEKFKITNEYLPKFKLLKKIDYLLSFAKSIYYDWVKKNLVFIKILVLLFLVLLKKYFMCLKLGFLSLAM